MRLFSSDDLTGIMRKCAGMEDTAQLDGPVLELSYEEMGYDSLAVLEIQGQIERIFGVPLGDDAIDRMPTPGRTISYVNSLLQAGA
jgi:act minimal PKS acyl carrier protein